MAAWFKPTTSRMVNQCFVTELRSLSVNYMYITYTSLNLIRLSSEVLFPYTRFDKTRELSKVSFMIASRVNKKLFQTLYLMSVLYNYLLHGCKYNIKHYKKRVSSDNI